MLASGCSTDLQNNAGFSDPKSWVPGGDSSRPTHSRSHSVVSCSNSIAGSIGSVDPVLYNDIMAIFPLIHSLIDQKETSSFTRRGSMVYTKAPCERNIEMKGTGVGQSFPARKPKDPEGKDRRKNVRSRTEECTDKSVTDTDKTLAHESEEESNLLRKQLEDMQKKLADRDEILKSADAMKQKLDELKHQNEEKDSLIKSIQSKLSDTMVRLAERQSALEKAQWEAQVSQRKEENLQADLDSVHGSYSAIVHFFEDLLKNKKPVPSTAQDGDDGDDSDGGITDLPLSNEVGDTEMKALEDAQAAYLHAVAEAKEKRDETSTATAIRARLYLQSILSTGSSITPSL